MVAAPQTVPAIQFRDTPVTFTDSSGQQVYNYMKNYTCDYSNYLKSQYHHLMQVTTQLQYKSGGMTWLIAAVICFLTGCICLVPIPFCINATKDVVHINPNDGSIVGVYKRI